MPGKKMPHSFQFPSKKDFCSEDFQSFGHCPPATFSGLARKCSATLNHDRPMAGRFFATPPQPLQGGNAAPLVSGRDQMIAAGYLASQHRIYRVNTYPENSVPILDLD